MTDSEKLQAIAALIRSGDGLPQPSEAVAQAFGLVSDRWVVSLYSGTPAVCGRVLADYLDDLAQRLADERVQLALVEVPGFHQPLAKQAEQLRAAVAGQRVVGSQAVEDLPGGVEVVQIDGLACGHGPFLSR